jgi:hypothetical protein
MGVKRKNSSMRGVDFHRRRLSLVDIPREINELRRPDV